MRIKSAYSHPRVLMVLVALLALTLLPAAASAAPKNAKLRFSTSSYSVVEGSPTFTATVLRSGNTRTQVSVHYATADGTALAGTEYAATSGTLTFLPGQTRQTFTITIIDNQIAGPPSKNLKLNLSAPSGASIPPGQASSTLTIFDNDGPGTIDFGSASYSVVESAGVATITVTRASATNLVESVDYTTSDGTATAGSDYTTTSGTLTFNAGEMSKSFQVPITDDQSFEGDETVDVALSNPQNITTPLQPPVLGPNSNAGPVTLTIVDDDVPTFTFDQPTSLVDEDAGHATITVNRGGDTSIAATVHYATSDGTAVAGADYTATSGDLAFAAGQTSNSFQVPITLNGVPNEANKTINLQLTENGSPVDSALLSIVEADPGTTTPSVQFASPSYSVDEADANVTLTVTLSQPATGDVTVHYATADGTGLNAATAGPPSTTDGSADYTAGSGTLTFHAGDQTKTIDVALNPDTVPEGDETFTAKLTSPSGAVGGAPSQATITIVDDDSAGTLNFSALRYDAGESSGHATIRVQRSGGSGGSVSLDYFTSDGTAHAPGDYTATSGTLTFGDGETTKTFDIPIAWDGIAEGDETVSIGLENFASDDDPAAVKVAVLHIADAGASGPVQFSAGAYNVAENGGSATITVNRSGGSLGGPVTVEYATSDGTAHAGTDYTETHGTLTFGSGEASKTFQVPVKDDSIHQGGRSLSLTLSNPGGGTALGSQATAALNIADDEPASAASTDKTPPTLKLTVKKLQKALTAKRLVIKVRSNETATLAIKLRLRNGKTRTFVVIAKGSKKVAAAKAVTIKLTLSKKALAKLHAVLANGRVKVRVSVKGTDAAHNSTTVNKTVTIR